MAYSAEISRTNPACFLFLIDQSGSMQEVLAPADIQPMAEPTFVDGKSYSHTASGKTKADAVADAINRLLQNLVLLCAKPEGVRDYFHIGVLGYGGQHVDPSGAGLWRRPWRERPGPNQRDSEQSGASGRTNKEG